MEICIVILQGKKFARKLGNTHKKIASLQGNKENSKQGKKFARKLGKIVKNA